MKIEDRILKALKNQFQDVEILGVRFIKKEKENYWSFRFTFKEGDYLSLSDLYIAEFKGLEIKIEKINIFKSPGVFAIEKDLIKVKNKQK
jgi:hypothetical protein